MERMVDLLDTSSLKTVALVSRPVIQAKKNWKPWVRKNWSRQGYLYNHYLVL